MSQSSDWRALCDAMVRHSQAGVDNLRAQLYLYQVKVRENNLTHKDQLRIATIRHKLKQAKDMRQGWTTLYKDAVMEEEEDMGLRQNYEWNMSDDSDCGLDNEEREEAEEMGEGSDDGEEKEKEAKKEGPEH